MRRIMMDANGKKITLVFLHILLIVLPVFEVMAKNSTSIKAVLFYPPFCATCPAVIEDYLVPLSVTHAERLELYPVDITESPGGEIYTAVLEKFGDAADSRDIPSVLIGQQLLRGETTIREGLLPLIETPPSESANWPRITGLQQMITGGDIDITQDQQAESDTLATGLAWTVMSSLLFSLAFAVWRLVHNGNNLVNAPRLDSWSLPLFAIVGLAIGAYLTSVALTHSEALCGPVGDCMRVQTSPYSKLFGIPMALWGIVYYLGILGLWYMHRLLSGIWHFRLTIGLLVLSLFAVVFSVYLTGLELFVIHAVCVWCLASAVLTLLIMLVVVSKLATANPSSGK